MVWVAGHFGEWLQGLIGPAGEVALVTVACPVRGAEVTVRKAAELSVLDPSGALGADRAAAMLAALGLPTRLRVEVVADLPPGGGAGMSTAALVALARAAGAAEERIAAACLAVEGAVDPLMLPAPDGVLWASRAARMLQSLSPPPAAEILGAFWKEPAVTDPADRCFPAVDDLVAEWAGAPELRNAARLASLSAVRTSALRGPADDPTPALAARLGALGWARAHTGSARALIFAPGAAPKSGEAVLTGAGYSHALRFSTGVRR